MPRVKLFNQDVVLYKAMELFWKSGYHATSMQELVTHLGINRASLYDTFGGKKELFDQSLALYCDTNKRETRQFLQKQKSVKDGLRALFENTVFEATSDIEFKGCFVVNTTTELIPGDEEIKKALLENRSIYEEIFYEFLLSGEQSGEISKDKDLRAIAGLIYILLSGIKVIAKIEPNQTRILSSINTVLSLLD